MEILKGHETSVKFRVPKALTTATYKVWRGTLMLSEGNAEVDNGLATVEVPWEATREPGKTQVALTFNYLNKTHTENKNVHIATPILDLHEIEELLETGTEQEFRTVEAATRHIINAHCGQEFDFIKNEERIARGDGNHSLILPARALTIHNIGTPFSKYQLKDDGWRLEASVYDYESGSYYMPHGVIRLPGVDPRLFFKDDTLVTVRADWGWEEVPEAVREAARLLVNDYACGDSLYRDRYLTSMTAADWRIQFHAGAFADTGNVRADQLLQDYVVLGGWLAV